MKKLILYFSILFLALPLSAESFISIWDTRNKDAIITKTDKTASQEKPSDKNQIKLPLISTGSYNFTIDWGDGLENKITRFDQPATTHTYDNPGIYTIHINGQLEGWRFNYGGDKAKIEEIFQWGDLVINNDAAFAGCVNMVVKAKDIPQLKKLTSAQKMFAHCQQIKQIPGLQKWDVSKISNMRFMFYNAHNFNQDLTKWDVSNVTTMFAMFNAAYKFNGDITKWEVQNVTDMRWMFCYSHKFNQDISHWETKALKDMMFMFYDAQVFNRNLAKWDVSNVTDMTYLFSKCPKFNQDISPWKVDNVTTMKNMFKGATSFNQDLSTWNISKVTNMNNMFQSVTLSTKNIDNMLNVWSKLKLQKNIQLHIGKSKTSTASEEAQKKLAKKDKWTIQK